MRQCCLLWNQGQPHRKASASHSSCNTYFYLVTPGHNCIAHPTAAFTWTSPYPSCVTSQSPDAILHAAVPRKAAGDVRAYERVETEPGLDKFVDDAKGKASLCDLMGPPA